ncbi:MAG TPA: bifunctional diguanylate cyclase/phosphodiesterase [Actinomycetes bacterium]
MGGTSGDRNRAGARTGAPFWGYIAVVAVTGLGVAGLLVTSSGDLRELGGRPAFWATLGLVLIGELRPIFTPGRPDPVGVTTSTAFSFAALLFFGLGAAVVVQALATALTGAVWRKAWWRTAFNLGQHTLCLALAGWVLGLGSLAALPQVGAPPGAGDPAYVAVAGVVYLVCNNGFVWVAIALFERRRLLHVVRSDVVFQVVVHGALIGIAPLVAVVMAHQWQLLPLFLLPLLAVQSSVAGSVERDRAALRDPLTGLANRTFLLRHAGEVLRLAEERGEKAGLFLLDLDRFKEVNETLGHRAGDRVLQLSAERLERTLRPGDQVARLGSDEFAVLLPAVRDTAAAQEVARRILAAFEEPFTVDGTRIDLEPSIGIALHPQHGTDVEQLLQRADVAMYLAKSERTGLETYAAERDTNSPGRLGLLGALRRAVDRGELELHYQPKVRVCDGSPAGVEALLRWNHPTRGLVLPDEFVPLAEQSGLMPRLTALVLDTALRQAAEWARQGLTVPVAINVSMRDLHDAEFAARLGTGLLRHALPAHLLCLEITERVLMADVARAAATLAELDDLGVRISLDDFGTGYSSLVLLKRLPVREVKVDRSFVQRLGQPQGAEDDAMIVRSIIDLGHSLGLTVVAEGVESEAAVAQLRAFGCDGAQGWYYSPALPADEVTDWLRTRSADAALLRLPTARRRAAVSAGVHEPSPPFG